MRIQRKTTWGQKLVGFLLLIACLERDKGVREGAPESQEAQNCAVEAQAGRTSRRTEWSAEPVTRKGKHGNNND